LFFVFALPKMWTYCIQLHFLLRGRSNFSTLTPTLHDLTSALYTRVFHHWHFDILG
jgi:hypothetical protein